MNQAEQATTADTVLAALRANAEGCSTVDASGVEWKDVYLDNCRANTTPHQFAGFLSALKERGFYKTQGDNDFGSVRVK